MGLRVYPKDLGRRSGETHSSGLIYINDTKSLLTQRCTLAHEIGHAVYGHVWSPVPHENFVEERQANTYAARLLIGVDAYRRAERIVGQHAGALAKELNVSTLLIELWREWYLSEVRERPMLRLA